MSVASSNVASPSSNGRSTTVVAWPRASSSGTNRSQHHAPCQAPCSSRKCVTAARVGQPGVSSPPGADVWPGANRPLRHYGVERGGSGRGATGGVDMIVCAACGAENPESQHFCSECGTPLEVTCPACGATWPASHKFCGECGTALHGARASAPGAAPPATTERLVTDELLWASVLFVDLVGSTSLSEGLAAEDVRELMSGYFDRAKTVVTRYGGEVEKFVGDAVVAVWGGSTAHEDDAERAVRAALEILETVAEYGATRSLELRARGGVVTGQVATRTATDEGLVAGDRVNTAARVQSVAEPGTVLVDETTRRLSEAAVFYIGEGEHVLKGKAEPIALWRAERVVAGVGGTSRV